MNHSLATRAHAWASGLIEFRPVGTLVPEGALPVPDVPRAQIEAAARHGYDGSLLVPGVPEANLEGDSTKAVDAFSAWCKWVEGFEPQDSAAALPTSGRAA